jgi:hypothetical protein
MVVWQYFSDWPQVDGSAGLSFEEDIFSANVFVGSGFASTGSAVGGFASCIDRLIASRSINSSTSAPRYRIATKGINSLSP